MDDFMANLDEDEEWIGDTSQPVIPEESQCEEPTVEVLNNDELVSGSSSDDGETNIRKKSIRKIQRAHDNENAIVSYPFYLFQTFSSAEEMKEKVKEHAIETRRELVFAKNDKTRLRRTQGPVTSTNSRNSYIKTLMIEADLKERKYPQVWGY
ncbi:hypothetical protein LXL04_034946 [Taraxacum kok-saghyz]